MSKHKQLLTAKTIRIFAHSSTREQSNKRSGTRLKTESETGEAKTLTPRFTDFITDFEKKKPSVLQSKTALIPFLPGTVQLYSYSSSDV